jgi:hypothetical protein
MEVSDLIGKWSGALLTINTLARLMPDRSELPGTSWKSCNLNTNQSRGDQGDGCTDIHAITGDSIQHSLPVQALKPREELRP